MSSSAELVELRKRAEKLAISNDFGEAAIEINTKIIEIDKSRSIDAHNRLARCYLTKGNIVDAYKVYRQVLDLDPLNRIALNELKRIENNTLIKRIENAARKQQEKILKEKRQQQKESRIQKKKDKISAMTNYDELFQLAMTQKKRGQFDLAIAAFMRATELNPENPYVWTSLGSAYRQNDDAAEAYRAFERALELGGDEDIVFVGMAAAKHMMGNNASAIELYERVLKHNNRNIYALKGLATLYNDIGDLEKARKLFGRVHYLANEKDK